jgi:hypothetical protein
LSRIKTRAKDSVGVQPIGSIGGTTTLRRSEDNLFQQLESWLRCYGLAIACIILPLAPPNLASSLLMPERVENTKFSYILLSSISGHETRVGDDNARSADRAVDGRIRLDPLFTRHLADRNPLALVSKYSYVVDAVILIFAALVIVKRFGWIAYLAGIIVYGAAGYWIVYQSDWIQTLFRFGSPLFGVFDSVDATLSNLAPKDGTRQFVTWLIMTNLWLASVPVGMLCLSLCAASIRPADESLDLDGLRDRRLVIRWALALAAILFVLSIIGMKVSVDWPLDLLERSQAEALKPIANGLVLYAGANNTLIMIVMFAPALIAYLLDVRRYQALRSGAADQTAKVDDGLSFTTASAVVGAITMIAPLLTGPLMDLVKIVVFRS